MSTNRRVGGIARGGQAGSGPNAPAGTDAMPLPSGSALCTSHAVNNFAQKVQCLVEAKNLTGGSKISVNFGRRYARIVHDWGGQNMCWGWVDMSTGELLRGGWKQPAKTKACRGTIFDRDVLSKIDWTGPRYL